MSYLVDGNNVMGQRVGWHKDKPGARRRLLTELSRFARAAGVTLDVVFDGAPEEFFPDGSLFMGVRVYYAARGSNADERIKALVEASCERRTLLVVPPPLCITTASAVYQIPKPASRKRRHQSTSLKKSGNHSSIGPTASYALRVTRKHDAIGCGAGPVPS